MDSSNIDIKDVKVEVLNAIDTLRKRKTRPDFNNIANFLRKRCEFSEEQVEAYLEKMIKSEFVIKVDYKGNTSYRNAEKKERTSDNGQDVFISNDMPSILEKLVSGAIAHNKQKYGLSENTGASLTSIELQSMKCSFETNLNRKTLKLALDREVSYGNRIRSLSNGNYIPVKILNDILSNDENQSQSSSSSESDVFEISPPPVLRGSKQSHLKRPFTLLKERDPEVREKQRVKAKKKVPFPNGRLPKWMIPHVYAKPLGSSGNNLSKNRARPPSQRKRFKKYHGPDFLETSSLPSLDCIDPEPIVVEEEKKCDYCLMPASSNPSGIREELLICKDCNAKAHPSCMDYSSELARKSRLYPWQCMDCKICTVCEDAEDGECMLFCDSCDKGYHMSCHKPKIVEKPLGKWVCFQCGDEPQPKSSENLTTCRSKDQAKEEGVTTELSGLPTPCDSPASVESNDSDSKATLSVSNQIKDNSIAINSVSKLAYPEIVPDAKDWTMEDVYKFLNEIGFPEQAVVFRDQEIDGKSLLLMKRSDVLTGMPHIRLGPALKIYNHIKRLQIGNPDGKIHINPFNF